MFIARIALAALMMIGLVSQAQAGPDEDLAEKAALAARDTDARAVPAGCISAPYPSQPIGPSSTQNAIEDGFFPGAKVAMTMWRVACASDPRLSAVLLSVTGVSRGGYGSATVDPFICDINMQVIQGGRSYGSLNFRTEAGGYLCSAFPVGTSKVFVVDQNSFVTDGFDHQKALELRYRNNYPLTVADYVPNLRKFDVSLTITGTGAGRVTSSDNRLSCQTGNAGTCVAQYDETSTVTLNASADVGSQFAGWVQPGCGTAPTTTIMIQGAATCSAKFDEIPVDPQTGFWFDPARGGTGFGIERAGNRLLLSAYMFRPDGTPLWFNVSGAYSGRRFTGRLEQYSGGPPFGASTGSGLVAQPGGNVTVIFSSSTTAQITWDGLASPINLVRYLFGDQKPDAVASAGDASGPTQARMTPSNLVAKDLATAIGMSRVIVTLKDAGDARSRAGALQGRMAGLGLGRMQAMASTPQIIADVSPAALDALRGDPDVAAVEPDRPLFASLRQSVPIVQADQMRNAGVVGSGKSVVVIDSGVETTHPFLGNRTVAELCFSTNAAVGSGRAISACPNGETIQIGAGAARPCGAAECDHGTHVAGIAAGAGSDINGVAPGAGIIAIQVASMLEGPGCPPMSCWTMFVSDVLRALDWVNQTGVGLGAAAVNMSLGGDVLHSTYCDTSVFKPVIDALRAKGVATVVATGNDGSSWRISEPACISSAIAVGSTTKTHGISWFSNRWDLPMLMAPGSDIVSSVPGGNYAAMDGTSMATPHVAGAFVLLRSLFPSVSVGEIRNQLTLTGNKTGNYRRINIRDAAAALDLPSRVMPDNGWWWTPDAGGRGYFIEAQGSNVFVASYHYRSDGAAEWAVGQGQIASFGGLFQIDLRRYLGGTSLDGTPHTPSETAGLGQVSMQFINRQAGTIVLPDGRRQTLWRYSF